MKERKIYLDIIRVIACIMVVCMHSPIPGDSASNYGPFLVLSSYLTAPAVPLFFMVSGALLLPCKEGVSAIDYLKKRISKIIGPTLCFTALYMAWDIYNTNPDTKTIITNVLSIPFCVQGHGVLWFMYTLIGLYLLIPIVSQWIRNASKKELEFYLILWGITLMYPFIEMVLRVETKPIGILYYFTGYAGYFLLGHYLSKYDVSLKVLVPLAVLMLPMPLVSKVLGWNVDFYAAFWYLSITVAIMTAACFSLIKKVMGDTHKIDGVLGKFVETTSNLSFGIYLVHIFLMRAFLWYLPFVAGISNYYIQTLVVAILTFASSWLFSWLVAKLPIGQYIIGYSSKK